MPLLKTTRNDDEGTDKVTLRLSDEWIPAVHYSETNESQLSLVVETITERFVLDIYVTDREAALAAFDGLFTTLQELQIGD